MTVLAAYGNFKCRQTCWKASEGQKTVAEDTMFQPEWRFHIPPALPLSTFYLPVSRCLRLERQLIRASVLCLSGLPKPPLCPDYSITWQANDRNKPPKINKDSWNSPLSQSRRCLWPLNMYPPHPPVKQTWLTALSSTISNTHNRICWLFSQVLQMITPLNRLILTASTPLKPPLHTTLARLPSVNHLYCTSPSPF